MFVTDNDRYWQCSLLIMFVTDNVHYWQCSLLTMFVTDNVRYWQCSLLTMFVTDNVRYWQYSLLTMFVIVNVRYWQCSLLTMFITDNVRKSNAVYAIEYHSNLKMTNITDPHVQRESSYFNKWIDSFGWFIIFDGEYHLITTNGLMHLFDSLYLMVNINLSDMDWSICLIHYIWWWILPYPTCVFSLWQHTYTYIIYTIN